MTPMTDRYIPYITPKGRRVTVHYATWPKKAFRAVVNVELDLGITKSHFSPCYYDLPHDLPEDEVPRNNLLDAPNIPSEACILRANKIIEDDIPHLLIRTDSALDQVIKILV